MIRTEKLVPEIYLKSSRDFQLFCKILDTVINSVEFEIDSMINVLNPQLCKDSFVELLSSYFNYNPIESLSTDDLRLILSNYRYLIKNRGCKKGIRKAIDLVLLLNGSKSRYTVDIYNKVFTDNILDLSRSYKIIINLFEKTELRLFNEIINKVKPVGYTVEVSLSVPERFETKLKTSNSVEIDPQTTMTTSFVSSDSILNEINRVEIISDQSSTDMIWYDNNLQNNIILSQSIIYNVNNTVTLNDGTLFNNTEDPTKNIVSWNTKSDGSGESFSKGITADISDLIESNYLILYAIWG